MTVHPRSARALPHDARRAATPSGVAGGRLRPCSAAVVLLAAALAPRAARAYRPFDLTDAAVVAAGEIELEIGPVGFSARGRERSLVMPDLVANVGLSDRLELVAEARQLIHLQTEAGERWELADAGVFLKYVVRPGALQGRPGPSVAVEAGALLPGVGGESGAGAEGLAIVSSRCDVATLHLGGAVARSRAGELALEAGAIVEGPRRWRVRPVAELLASREGDERTLALLGGAIWRATEHLALDAGVQVASVGGEGAFEVRAGLTWAFEAGGRG